MMGQSASSSGRGRLARALIGALVSFSALSIYAHLMPQRLLGFSRFHVYVAPDTFFYPPVESVFQTVLSQVTKDKKIVILGGSSIPLGTGQPAGQTIADDLQGSLGPDYAVFNLAMRGGDVGGMGLFVSEMLLASGYDVYFIADVFYGELKPTGINPIYDYIFRQYQSEPLFQAYKPRDQSINNKGMTEPLVGAWLNSWLRFDNFWNQFGFDHLFTVYSRFVRSDFWQPRSGLADPERALPVGWFRDSGRGPVEVSALLALARAHPTEAYWEKAEASWQATLPEAVRGRTLLMLCRKNPFFIKMMPIEDQEAMTKLYDDAEQRYHMIGIHAAQTCNDLVEDDYADGGHLAPTGAEKAAEKIAHALHQLPGF